MNNALKKIVARAKQIRKAHPGKKWTSCIKEAGAEFRAGAKKPAAKKKATAKRQTGKTKSVKADRSRRALPPGKRRSKSGSTYYERRRNRSDVPGRVSGVTGGFKNMAEIRAANKASGKFFFSPATMKLFGTKIVSPVIDGHYFITSDRNYDGTKREYKIRKAAYPSGAISTIMKPQGGEASYRSKGGAEAALRKHLGK